MCFVAIDDKDVHYLNCDDNVTIYIYCTYQNLLYTFYVSGKVCTLLYVNYALLKLFLEVKKNILFNFKKQ